MSPECHAAIVQPKSASTSSTCPRGRKKRDALAPVFGGLADAPAPAHGTEGLDDPAAAPGLKAFQGFSERLILILVPESCDEGFEDEPPSEPVPERFKERLVLILASNPRDEGFEEEATTDPVSEGFKEQLVLVLASEVSPGTVKSKPDSKAVHVCFLPPSSSVSFCSLNHFTYRHAACSSAFRGPPFYKS
ncbi:hypothetical protein ATANTOWER_030643 [Ataeniobius toweri]|uniref:Uncharacterized protein n=1 Tax=Ataeniobius toweri TaxID=208326 RepID=A0ABU7B080_9TELE|nr:hypothetical protein [Ataeniobius toweri]